MNYLRENIDYSINNGILVFSDSVNIIPPHSFENRNDFYKVVIPKNLEYIGEYAFDSNKELEYIDFTSTASLKEIDKYAFRDCSLKRLVLPNSITYLGEGAFDGSCRDAKEIVIPNGIKIIPPKCFSECRTDKVIIPFSVEVIGPGAFSYSKIGKIVIPSSVKIIGRWIGTNNGVLDASKFTGYSYGGIGSFIDNKMLINNGAYYEYAVNTKRQLFPIKRELKKLTRKDYSIDSNNVLTINEGVELIPTAAFYPSSIRKIIFPSTLKVIEPSAFKYSKVISLEFPKSLESISSEAFCDCFQLKEVKFNNGLLAINDRAFQNTDLTDVELPDTILFLGSSAFKTLGNNTRVRFNPKGNSLVYTNDNNLVCNHPNDYNDSCVIINESYNRLDMKNPTTESKYSKNILNKYDIEDTRNRKVRTPEERKLLSELLLDKIVENDPKNENIIEYLIQEGADLDYVGANGKVILHELYKIKSTKLLIECIKYGANIDSCTSDNNTLLMLALKEKDYVLINILVELGSSLNIENSEGYTPLMYAVLTSDEETVNYLLSAGADPYYINKNGITAQMIARDNNVKNTICLFGVKTKPINIDNEEKEIKSDMNKLLQLLK